MSLEICKQLRACLGEICSQVLNTLASTDITSITGDMPYHSRSDAIEKRLRFSKVSADLLTELMDTLNINQAVFAGLSLGSFLVQQLMVCYPNWMVAEVYIRGGSLARAFCK